MSSAGPITAPNRTTASTPKRLEAVTPRLRKLLFVLFGLFALLAVDSAYLVSITILEWATRTTYQNYFYQFAFLIHLILGFAIILPAVLFGLLHMRNARHLPLPRVIKLGYALFAAILVVLITGLILTRLDLFGLRLEVKDPYIRNVGYWLHVTAPVAVMWLFVLHRLAGRRLRWRVGAVWACVAGSFAIVMVLLHSQDPRNADTAAPSIGDEYFAPSLARTATGKFIPAESLMQDQYCKDCHADVHATWESSVHRFSSFNNEPYLFSIRGTRRALYDRDGSAAGSRFCAGCHDLVPFFSGAFDDPKYDDPDYDLTSDPLAQAGITCSGCHAITRINSPRGNADFTIDEPPQYPFTYSESPLLRWVNRQLIKAKPAFHKTTFLKPFHKTPDFCGTCHKVHLPESVNAYKWLRGQNHYDSYQLSGVSGHGIQSFYYPPKATHACAECHMPLTPSDDFGAQYFDNSGTLKVHDHQFPAANTALPQMHNLPSEVNEKHQAFLQTAARVDIFGLKEGGAINGKLTAPIRPDVPTLQPGKDYLLETIIRTVGIGHLFTQGTADSNQVWLDITVTSGDRVIGKSGGRDATSGEVDPWSHFVNAYVIDREGNRIDRRNAEDIFVALYNHQIPPGAADAVHYRLQVPPDVTEAITVEVKLQYRKFDTLYMRYFMGDKFVTNDLPITTMATDRVTFPVAGSTDAIANESSSIPTWQRWNDYGIGLFRKGNSGANRGELRQAEAAFAKVEELGRPDGPLNRARVYIKEGRLEEAVAALSRAAAFDPPAPPWSVAWFTGLVNKQNGYLDEAITNFTSIVELDSEETREREFDFSQDYRLLNELAQTIFERSKQERGEARLTERKRLQNDAAKLFERVIEMDPENTTAHHNLSLIWAQLGQPDKAVRHRAEHARYKPDDNARDRAVAAARRLSPAANHAADAIVIYDLTRPGAYELPEQSDKVTLHD